MSRWCTIICFIIFPVLSADAASYDPLGNYQKAARHAFDKQNLITLGAGFGAALIARQYDDDFRSTHARQNRLQGSETVFNEFIGTGVPGALIGAGFWWHGARNERSYEVHAGQAQLEALLATGVLTVVMKGLVGRERPDGSDRYSFPSGHTSTVSASAMTLTEFYGWKVGVPAFAVVALTGYSRVSGDRHWLSDVIGGTTLGMVVGHAVARAHLNELEGVESAVRFFPVLDSEGGRLVFLFKF